MIASAEIFMRNIPFVAPFHDTSEIYFNSDSVKYFVFNNQHI